MLCSIIHERCWENNVLKLSLDYFSCLCVFMSGIRNCCVYIKTPLRNRKYFIDNLLFVWKFVLWEDFFLDVLDANCLLFLNVNKIINSEKDDGWFFFLANSGNIILDKMHQKNNSWQIDFYPTYNFSVRKLLHK